MTEQNNKKKKLTLTNNPTNEKIDTESIRQSFPHGKTKTVTVEVKKRRFPPQNKNQYTNQLNDNIYEKNIKKKMNEKELLRRRKALEVALRNKANDFKKEQNISKSEQVSANEQINTYQKEENNKQYTKINNTIKTPDISPNTNNISPQNNLNKIQSTKQNNKQQILQNKNTLYNEDINYEKKQLIIDKQINQSNNKNIITSETLENKKTQGIDYQTKLTSTKTSKKNKKIKKIRKIQEPIVNNIELKPISKEIILPEDRITIKEFSKLASVSTATIKELLLELGLVIKDENAYIITETAELLAHEIGHKTKRMTTSDFHIIKSPPDDPAELKPRAPVITVMGHVDHGKTSLLDALRKSNITSSEAGGITQHIGAYQVTFSSNQKVTFLDTPGHAAFTNMRSRGSNITDLVILVVAADDGIKEQTIEAINHATSAKVPIIVAINKIDKANANPDKIRTDLLQHKIIVEKMSGDVLDVEISAKNKIGIDKLEEIITLQSEMLELKANPNRTAEGRVIESKIEKGHGSVATVLIQRGTLNIGDHFVVGAQWGKVRALINDKKEKQTKAGPSTPIEVLGLNGPPEAGDRFYTVKNATIAKKIFKERQEHLRKTHIKKSKTKGFEQFLSKNINPDKVKTLNIVIKTDVKGTLEALISSLDKIGNNEVTVNILHSGIGEINENDISLANASKGFVFAFNVRANSQAKKSAKKYSIHIRYYSIIYEFINDVKSALSGLLSPDLKEEFLGYAKVQTLFNVTKIGRVAGCLVTEGLIKKGAGIRLLRDNIVIHEGTIKTLKRFKDEVKEVRESLDCGISFENYQDIHVNDQIECFYIKKIARTLD